MSETPDDTTPTSEQHRRRRIRIPRRITVGTPRANQPGAVLDCLVLATRSEAESAGGEECLGIDLASGAFVRVVGAGPVPLAPPGLIQLVRLTIAPEGEPADPARPELVVASPGPEQLGSVRVRRARRLLDSLVVADRPGTTLLGTRGPSVAYVDLDGTTPSLVLLAAKRTAPSLVETNTATQLRVTFGGVTQLVPVVDRRAVAAARRAAPRPIDRGSLAAELGFRPGYLLVGLDAVQEGHVRKVVLAILPRVARRRGATSAASRRRGPRPSPSRS